MKSNPAKADEAAARELCLYIENEYALVGAPYSQGKAIEKNLLRKIRNGTFDREKAERAWLPLTETGAKRYARQFADILDWYKIFSKPTRELVAHYFAEKFLEEQQLNELKPNSLSTIETTFPYETTSPGVARHQCTECGGWERSDKGLIRHSKRCESRAQGIAERPTVEKSTEELRDFASKVRRTGMTYGRDEDVAEAVRRGYLSVSDAMNTDD